MNTISKIVLFPKIQADTAAGLYLLRRYGETAFPGISQAPLEFWTALPEGAKADALEREGYLLIDLGGRFDHHLVNERLGRRAECVSTLVAKALGLDNKPELKKLLTWAKRDDLEGKGTVSTDPIDRAFGLSGIIMNLNREYHATPQKILDVILPIIDVHVREEIRRHVELPQEWQKLLQEKKAETFMLQQGPADLKVGVIQSDNVALPGFLRAAHGFDLLIQRRSTGHTNILTRQLRSIDLRPVVEELRLAEAQKKGFFAGAEEELQKSGRLDGVPEWYYDTAANTIQNGGVSPEGVNPTALDLDEVVAIVKDAIPHGRIGTLKREREREKQS
jgi:hypothetical protein